MKQDVCKIGETVKVDPDPQGRKESLLNCKGNLCNSSNKLYHGNVLFIAVLFSCVYKIAGWLFNWTFIWPENQKLSTSSLFLNE